MRSHFEDGRDALGLCVFLAGLALVLKAFGVA